MITWERVLRAPFFLLCVNRDDDALSFIRYWVELDEDVILALEQMYANSANTREGEWIYPRDPAGRYSELFQNMSDADLCKIERPFLVALVIIKQRIVAAHEALLRGIEFKKCNSTFRKCSFVPATTLKLIDISFSVGWVRFTGRIPPCFRRLFVRDPSSISHHP
jgi:hypothetical protein